MNELRESKALLEVREWKSVCAREVAGLEIGAAVRKRLKDSAETARRLGFLVGTGHEPLRLAVAEPGVEYGKR